MPWKVCLSSNDATATCSQCFWPINSQWEVWKRSWELTWRTQEEISDFNWHQLTVRLNVVTRQPQRRGGSRWSNPTQHLRAFKPVSSGAKTTWMFDQRSIFWSWRIKKCSCSNGYLKPPHGNVVSPLRRLGEWGAQLDQKTPYNLQLPLANQASQLTLAIFSPTHPNMVISGFDTPL